MNIKQRVIRERKEYHMTFNAQMIDRKPTYTRQTPCGCVERFKAIKDNKDMKNVLFLRNYPVTLNFVFYLKDQEITFLGG